MFPNLVSIKRLEYKVDCFKPDQNRLKTLRVIAKTYWIKKIYRIIYRGEFNLEQRVAKPARQPEHQYLIFRPLLEVPLK